MGSFGFAQPKPSDPATLTEVAIKRGETWVYFKTGEFSFRKKIYSFLSYHDLSLIQRIGRISRVFYLISLRKPASPSSLLLFPPLSCLCTSRISTSFWYAQLLPPSFHFLNSSAVIFRVWISELPFHAYFQSSRCPLTGIFV